MSWLLIAAEQAEVFVEVDQPAQVIDVVDVRVVRMQLDEAVAGGDRRSRLLVLPVGVGDVDLRLLRIAAVGIARFELFKVLDGLRVGALVERILGFGVELVGRPADGFILGFGRSPQPAIREATKSAAITAKLRMMKNPEKKRHGDDAPKANREPGDYSANPRIALSVPADCSAQRLDQVLARLLAQHSRSRLQGWIREGGCGRRGASSSRATSSGPAKPSKLAEAPDERAESSTPGRYPCRWCTRTTA
jgi:hypothetical protein